MRALEVHCGGQNGIVLSLLYLKFCTRFGFIFVMILTVTIEMYG